MTLHVRDEGAGAPLVLLHGLGASHRVFEPLFARRGERRLLAVDLPRTGRSGHWAPSTPHGIADELLRYLDRSGVGHFELFGHSFGGLVSLELAAREGDRVRRLAVASTPALGVPAELKLLLANPMLDVSMGWFGRLPVWRPALKSYLAAIWGGASTLGEHHVALYEEALQAPGFNDGMLEALRALGRFRAPLEALAKAPIEKHVLWGEKDRLVSVVQGEQLARAIGAELRVLTDVGHCVPDEHPEAVAELLLR